MDDEVENDLPAPARAPFSPLIGSKFLLAALLHARLLDRNPSPSPSSPWQPPGRLSAGLHVHTMKKNARQF